MITLISGTNRNDSNTLRVTQYYFDVLQSKGIDVKIISLTDYDVHYRSETLKQLEEEVLIGSDKFIFVVPEYNASIPGILKLMIDNTDVRKVWANKKALLVGLATGRGGNVRGLDHFTNILNYLKVNVHHNKILLSKVHEELDINGQFAHLSTQEAIKYQIDEFLDF